MTPQEELTLAMFDNLRRNLLAHGFCPIGFGEQIHQLRTLMDTEPADEQPAKKPDAAKANPSPPSGLVPPAAAASGKVS